MAVPFLINLFTCSFPWASSVYLEKVNKKLSNIFFER